MDGKKRKWGIKFSEKWLLTLLGCNENMRYALRVVGNSPEFMPLDMLLFHNLKQAIHLHCAITQHLPKDDNRKFSTDTPSYIVSAVKQLVEGHLPEHGVPCSDRIVHDVGQAFDAMKIVCNNKGGIVEGLANWNGHRYSKEGMGKHGGVCMKEEGVITKWMHPIVREV